MTDLHHRAERALHEHAHRMGDGRWWFSTPGCAHTEAQALAITEACLLLDTPVTDVLTPRAWLRLVDRMASLQERLDRIEGTAP